MKVKHAINLDECVHKNSYSFSKRIKNYPFSQASQIKLVSFINNNSVEANVLLDLVKSNNSLLSKMKEVVSLNISQVDSLTDIIYNNFYRGNSEQILTSLCYHPRNGILFYNKEGKLFECFEICFECRKISTITPKINFGSWCDNKFALLSKFFILMEIKYVSAN